MEIRNNDHNSQKILFILNIISLILAVQGLVNFLFHGEDFLHKSVDFILIDMAAFLIIFYACYSILFITKKFSLNNKFLMLFEMLVLLTLFLLIIILTSGSNNDAFKVLFLFNIIRASIRKGLKAGLFVSFISCTLIFVIDSVLIKNYLTTITFQNDISLFTIFVFSACILGYYINTSRNHVTNLENVANKDGLTNLYNHRYFYDKIKELINISQLKSKKLSLIFLDIDDFKYYNDSNGHQMGDYALKILANILKDCVRKKDIVCRYGGEEFAVIMPDMELDEAIICAEKIRLAMEKTKFEGEEDQPKGKLTISIGVSEFPKKAKNDVELVKSADDALYRAKFIHKNRVETYASVLDDFKGAVNTEDKEVIASIKTLINVINAKDRYTYGHVERVVIYAKLIADKLKLNTKDRETLIYGAYIHDIGKINIPKQVLVKKMPLSDEEWLELRQHPSIGFEIIKNVSALKYVAPLVLHHHERYDGLGYPSKLKGNNIPYLVRILTVIDSFDAMTSNRPYNKCKSYEQGKEELLKCSGSQFDPAIVQAFVEVIDKTLIE